MKRLSSIVLTAMLVSQTAFAAGAVYNRAVEAFLDKTGTGMVYRNGKKTLKKERVCALVRSDFATESFDRDILTIAFDGAPLSNNYGVNAHGHYVQGSEQTLWDGPLFYDPVTAEKKIKDGANFGFEFCTGESDTAFAGPCGTPGKASWTQQIMIFPEQRRIEQSLAYVDGSGKKTVTKVVCRLD
jgi:hypothetical protein